MMMSIFTPFHVTVTNREISRLVWILVSCSTEHKTVTDWAFDLVHQRTMWLNHVCDLMNKITHQQRLWELLLEFLRCWPCVGENTLQQMEDCFLQAGQVAIPQRDYCLFLQWQALAAKNITDIIIAPQHLWNQPTKPWLLYIFGHT